MPKRATQKKQKGSPRVCETEQLYLVRKPSNGSSSNGNGFRHHRPKENRDDGPAEFTDPTQALADFADNKRGAINKLLSLNAHYRAHPWPAPFDETKHVLRLGDARDLAWIADGSVHLVVTSPPYWTLKKYEDHEHQLGEIADYDRFLDELDKVWRECAPTGDEKFCRLRNQSTHREEEQPSWQIEQPKNPPAQDRHQEGGESARRKIAADCAETADEDERPAEPEPRHRGDR